MTTLFEIFFTFRCASLEFFFFSYQNATIQTASLEDYICQHVTGQFDSALRDLRQSYLFYSVTAIDAILQYIGGGPRSGLSVQTIVFTSKHQLAADKIFCLPTIHSSHDVGLLEAMPVASHPDCASIWPQLTLLLTSRMTNEIDREWLEHLLDYPEMPPGFPVPVPVKQEPEAETADIATKCEPSTEDQEVKTEELDVKTEEQEIKQEIKQEVDILEHLITTYRPYGTTPDEDGHTISCRLCNVTCKNMLELLARWPVHVGVDTTKCIVCNVRCSNMEMAKQHINHGKHLNKMRMNEPSIAGDKPRRWYLLPKGVKNCARQRVVEVSHGERVFTRVLSMDAYAFRLGRASRSYNDQTIPSYHPEGTYCCTLLMITYSWNARQRAHLAQLNFSGAENAKLAANISFKKRDYLPTIHKDLRDHLMKLMVYIITTKGYDIKAEDNDEVKYTSLTAKIDVRELNHILKTTLLGVETFNNDEVDEEFAEVTLNVWGVLGFERVLMAAAKRYVLSSNGDGHAYWDLIAPKGLTGELTLLRGQIYHHFNSSWYARHWSALAQYQQETGSLSGTRRSHALFCYTYSLSPLLHSVHSAWKSNGFGRGVSEVVHMAERANCFGESSSKGSIDDAQLMPRCKSKLCVLSARINSALSRECIVVPSTQSASHSSTPRLSTGSLRLSLLQVSCAVVTWIGLNSCLANLMSWVKPSKSKSWSIQLRATLLILNILSTSCLDRCMGLYQSMGLAVWD
ncbi:hypothetical protein KCU75_g68, partial [Aureobasidium melanogenum]